MENNGFGQSEGDVWEDLSTSTTLHRITPHPPTQGLRDKVGIIYLFLFINNSPEETKTNCMNVVQNLHCSAGLTQQEENATLAVTLAL